MNQTVKPVLMCERLPTDLDAVHPDAERALSDLYFRTGRGAAQRQAARDVTRALEALVGQTIEKIAVTAAPGRHVIAINTDRAHLTLSVDRGGVQVDRVEVGG